MNNFPKSEVIMHYASPYYDPVKAHEYYEEHKQLKGRTSTAGLNEQGREAAKYIKDQLLAEKKKKTEDSKEEMKTRISNNKSQLKELTESNKEIQKAKIEAYKEATQSKIDTIKNTISKMSAKDKKTKGAQLRTAIASLRADNATVRKGLQEALKSANTSLRESNKLISEDARSTHKTNVEQYKKDYETTWEKELDALKSDSSMVSEKKRK